MYYYTREEQDQAAKNRIDALRECAGMFCLLRDVFLEYNNKCFNCRLEKAIKERVNSRVYVKKYGTHIDIYLCKNCLQFTLASVKIADMPEQKRIPADKLIQDARERREAHLQQAATIERNMQQVDVIRQQLHALRYDINKVADQLDYVTRDIYGLNVQVSIR